MLRLVFPKTAPSRHESCEAYDSLTGRSERLFFDDFDKRQNYRIMNRTTPQLTSVLDTIASRSL